MNHSSKFLVLREIALFETLNDMQIEQLCNQSTVLKIGKGKNLFYSGDHLNHVYLLIKGSVKIGRYTFNDKVLIKEIAYKNEMIGENFLSENENSREFAQALADAELYQIPITYFKSLLEHNPDFCQKITQILIQKMANLESRMSNFVFKKAQNRIIEFLKNLARTKGIKIGFDEILINHGLSHKEIAYITDTSRQTVARVLGELKRQNVIHFSTRKPHKILIRSTLDFS